MTAPRLPLDEQRPRRRVVDLLDGDRLTTRNGRRYLDLLAPPDDEAMDAAERGDTFVEAGGRGQRLAPIRIEATAPTAIEASVARARHGPEIDEALAGLQDYRRSRTTPRQQFDDTNPVTGLAKGLALGALSGPANMVSTYGEGLARTLGLDSAADAIERHRVEELDPVAAASPGSGLSTFASHLLPYVALGGKASSLVPGSALVKGLAGAAATLPLTGVQSMTGPEGSTVGMLAELTGNERLRRISDSTPARVATDVGLDATLGAATELAGPTLRLMGRGLDRAGGALGAAADATGRAAAPIGQLAGRAARTPRDWYRDLLNRINLIGAEEVELLPNVREMRPARTPLALPPGRAMQAALDEGATGEVLGPAIPMRASMRDRMVTNMERAVADEQAARTAAEAGEPNINTPQPEPAAAAEQPKPRKTFESFEAMQAELHAKKNRALAALGDGSRPVEFIPADGEGRRSEVFSKDTRTGKYRITSFGPEGPTGHIEYDSPDEAARALMSARPVGEDESQIARWTGTAVESPTPNAAAVPQEVTTPSGRRAVDLLGQPLPDETPAQAGMFGAKEGTAEARTTALSDRAARSRIARIAAEEVIEKNPARLQQLAAEKAQLLKQVNRDQKIGAAEMATRARGAAAPQPVPQATPQGDRPTFTIKLPRGVVEALQLDSGEVRASLGIDVAPSGKTQVRVSGTREGLEQLQRAANAMAESADPRHARSARNADVALSAYLRDPNVVPDKAPKAQAAQRDPFTGDPASSTAEPTPEPPPESLPSETPQPQPQPKAEALGTGLAAAVERAEESRALTREAKRQLKASARNDKGALRTNWLHTTDDNGLIAEMHNLINRIQEVEGADVAPWARQDEYGNVISGHSVKRHRWADDGRLIRSITEKLRERGYTDDEMVDALAQLDEQAAATAAEREAASAETQDDALDAIMGLDEDAVEREALGAEGALHDQPAPDGFDLFANPFMNPALLKRALRDRVVRGAVLAGVGAMTAQSKDEDWRATGRGMVGLGLLHAVGMKRLSALGGKGGGAVVRAIGDTDAGRAVLNFLSRDILMTPDVKQAVRQYEQGRAYAKARATELGRRLRRLAPSDDRIVSDIIEHEAFEPLPPQDAKAVLVLAKEVSDEFTRIGREKVAAGLLHPATVASREGQYLPRMYAEHLAKDPTPPGSKPLGRTTGPRQRREMRREELPDEVRNALGEVREASFRTELGVEKGWTNVAAAKLFDDLRQLPGVLHVDYVNAIDALRLAKQTGDRATIANAEALVAAVARDFENGGADGYVRLNDSAAYGVLRGAVVREDVAKYIEGLPQLGKTLPTLMHWWRKAHTVYNPGTHVGNFLSNTSLAHMAGLPLHEQVVALPKALGDLTAYGPDTKYLAEHGVLGASVATAGDARPGPGANLTQSLRELHGTTRPETRQILDERKVRPVGRVERAAREADAKVTRLYAAEDDIFRVALFQKYTSQGMPRPVAAELVRYRLVDYRSNSPALGMIRNTVSPFVMYSAKAVPMLTSQIIEHPVRWMTLAAAWAAANEFGEAKAGAIDEQRDLRPNQRTNRAAGYLLPGKVQLPFRDKAGNASVVDVARFTPLSSFTGSPAPGSLAMAMSDDVPGILQPTGPMIDLGARLTNTDPFTGDKLVKPGDDARDIAGAAAQGLASLALPSALSFHAPRVAADLANRDALSAAVDALGFVGARPTVVRPGAQAQREQRAFEDGAYNISRELRSDLRKTTDPDRKRALIERAAERMRKNAADFARRRTTSR